MLFGKNKKNAPKSSSIMAPVDGCVIPLEEVNDLVFAEKVLGDGAAIIPKSSTVLSPVMGTVNNVAETLHAFGIITPDGLEILVHIGINTVEMKGAGFHCRVKPGDTVAIGDPLCDVDLELIRQSGYETCIPVLITNSDRVKNVTVRVGEASAGRDSIIDYEK
jgi:glucose-specific phosphotransferase system IIA component